MYETQQLFENVTCFEVTWVYVRDIVVYKEWMDSLDKSRGLGIVHVTSCCGIRTYTNN